MYSIFFGNPPKRVLKSVLSFSFISFHVFAPNATTSTSSIVILARSKQKLIDSIGIFATQCFILVKRSSSTAAIIFPSFSRTAEGSCEPLTKLPKTPSMYIETSLKN